MEQVTQAQSHLAVVAVSAAFDPLAGCSKLAGMLGLAEIPGIMCGKRQLLHFAGNPFM